MRFAGEALTPAQAQDPAVYSDSTAFAQPFTPVKEGPDGRLWPQSFPRPKRA